MRFIKSNFIDTEIMRLIYKYFDNEILRLNKKKIFKSSLT